jgi:hypothetical protein
VMGQPVEQRCGHLGVAEHSKIPLFPNGWSPRSS